MKKIIILFALSLIFIISGCSCKEVEPVPVYIQPEVKEVCVECENKPAVDTCAKETKVIYYKDACSGSCGFPVTVRAVSNCDRGGM
jgi:hypothetical protein